MGYGNSQRPVANELGSDRWLNGPYLAHFSAHPDLPSPVRGQSTRTRSRRGPLVNQEETSHENCHNVQQKDGEFSAGHSWIRSFMRPFRIGSGVDWEAATKEAVAKVVKTDEWRAFLDERGASDKSPSITED